MTFAINSEEAFEQDLDQQNDMFRDVIKDDPLGEGKSLG